MFYCVVFLFTSLAIEETVCQRRIVDGFRVDIDVGYMAYIVKADKSPRNYTAWMCGGCIVHPSFILTSTSCLSDVKNVYAIIGYRKYVKSEDLDSDECTKRVKKRVISFCFPNDFGLKMNENFWWSWKETALARVESPYNFYDETFVKYCSWRPYMIKLNYNRKFVRPGTEVMTLGWGTTHYYRPEGDYTDYNEDYLRYTSTTIVDPSVCAAAYVPNNDDFSYYPTKMWICTNNTGSIDVEGKFMRGSVPVNGCRRSFGNSSACRYLEESGLRRTFSTGNRTYYEFTRRNGICQNDHGGPLVTWIGGVPHVIGIASTFLVNEKMECVGPFAFNGVICNSRFLSCALFSQEKMRRSLSDVCKGVKIVEKKYTWKNYTQP